MSLRIVLALLACAVVGAVRAGEPVAIGSALQLFVEDSLIADISGDARLRLHPPVRQNVAFTFDAPWEGPQSGYVTVLRDGERVRLYYRGGGDVDPDQPEVVCLAESADGIAFTRPNLGLHEFNGTTDNNIFFRGRERAYWEAHNFAPFLDTNPAADPAARYKAVALTRYPPNDEDRQRALAGLVSPDGIHWTHVKEEPIVREGAGFDSQNTALWDPNIGKYVCFSRVGRDGKRAIQRSLSDDFVDWGPPEHLEYDPPVLEQFYTNAIDLYFRAPHCYIGMPMRFVPERKRVGIEDRETDGLSDAVLIASRDGLHFDRLFLEAFIRPGLEPENWGNAHGNNTPARGIIQTGEREMSVYWCENYGGVPRLRRGSLRLDGFVSVNAGYNGGELLTVPMVFQGSRLMLNMSTSAVGSVRVELQDAAGNAIEGFALADSEEIWGDEIARPVRWKSGTDVSALAGRPVRLRFAMKDADLFAFRFE